MELATLKLVKPNGSEHPVTAIIHFRGFCLIYTANETYTPATAGTLGLTGIGLAQIPQSQILSLPDTPPDAP